MKRKIVASLLALVILSASSVCYADLCVAEAFGRMLTEESIANPSPFYTNPAGHTEAGTYVNDTFSFGFYMPGWTAAPGSYADQGVRTVDDLRSAIRSHGKLEVMTAHSSADERCRVRVLITTSDSGFFENLTVKAIRGIVGEAAAKSSGGNSGENRVDVKDIEQTKVIVGGQETNGTHVETTVNDSQTIHYMSTVKSIGQYIFYFDVTALTKSGAENVLAHFFWF